MFDAYKRTGKVMASNTQEKCSGMAVLQNSKMFHCMLSFDSIFKCFSSLLNVIVSVFIVQHAFARYFPEVQLTKKVLLATRDN